MKREFEAFKTKTNKEVGDLKKTFDMDALKREFCTKLGPDNIIKKVSDLELRVKGMKSMEDRISDLEKECSNIKSTAIQPTTIDYIEERLTDVEGLKPFVL